MIENKNFNICVNKGAFLWSKERSFATLLACSRAARGVAMQGKGSEDPSGCTCLDIGNRDERRKRFSIALKKFPCVVRQLVGDVLTGVMCVGTYNVTTRPVQSAGRRGRCGAAGRYTSRYRSTASLYIQCTLGLQAPLYPLSATVYFELREVLG